MDQSNPTNHTLYIQNINDKIKYQSLRPALYLLFSQCGEVIAIHCHRGKKFRGQAWIIYKQLSDSKRAFQMLQNHSFFGKKLIIQYSFNKSDIVSSADGTYVPVSQRERISVESLKRKTPCGGLHNTDHDFHHETALDISNKPLTFQKAPSRRILFENLPVDTSSESVVKMLLDTATDVQAIPYPSQNANYSSYLTIFSTIEHAVSAFNKYNEHQLNDMHQFNLQYVVEDTDKEVSEKKIDDDQIQVQL